jgi:hypothetical protein
MVAAAGGLLLRCLAQTTQAIDNLLALRPERRVQILRVRPHYIPSQFLEVLFLGLGHKLVCRLLHCFSQYCFSQYCFLQLLSVSTLSAHFTSTSYPADLNF